MRNRVVWVTGASSGMGEEIAYELARRGARIAITARRAERLVQVAQRCRELGASDVAIAAADITDAEAVVAARDSCAGLGAVDIVILNAGTWTPMPARRFDAEELARQYEVNVVGTARCIEAVLPAMLRRGAGRIAIVSSLTAFTGLPLAAAYGSSKAALRSMADSLRADLAGTGVEVTTVLPGFVRTPMTADNDFAMPQLMDPADAARVIVNGIDRGRPEIIFPRALGLFLRVLGSVPGPLRRRIVARMGRSANSPTNGAPT